jgi:hypothetical protein
MHVSMGSDARNRYEKNCCSTSEYNLSFSVADGKKVNPSSKFCHLFSEDARFDIRPEHRLYWLRVLMFLFSPSRKMSL